MPLHVHPLPWTSLLILGALGVLGWRIGAALPLDSRARSRTRTAPRRFLAGEERASALFDFALTLPLFLMIVLIVIQMALMINARLVVGWAAYAAARSAVVNSDGGVEAARREAEAAAAIGTLPIAPSSPLHAWPDPAVLPLLLAGHENPRLPGNQLSRRWSRTAGKLAGARQTTAVEIGGADRHGRFGPHAPVTVAVTHRYRLRVPWAGGVLAALVGRRAWTGPEVAIEETVTLLNQGRVRTGGRPGEKCPDLPGNLYDWVMGALR